MINYNGKVRYINKMNCDEGLTLGKKYKCVDGYITDDEGKERGFLFELNDDETVMKIAEWKYFEKVDPKVFKVGDLVRTKKKLVDGKLYGNEFRADFMNEMKIDTFDEITQINRTGIIELKNKKWSYTPQMLKHVKETVAEVKSEAKFNVGDVLKLKDTVKVGDCIKEFYILKRMLEKRNQKIYAIRVDFDSEIGFTYEGENGLWYPEDALELYVEPTPEPPKTHLLTEVKKYKWEDIKVGDIVKIKSDLGCYHNYKKFFDFNNISILKSFYAYGVDAEKYNYEVLHIGKHDFTEIDILVLRHLSNNRVYLYGLKSEYVEKLETNVK